ncbi:MAG: hypothetical protein J0M09_16350 [Xanthomonadales bacterium]|nr:hypothetical protein [Xanthomonadales bacterium]
MTTSAYALYAADVSLGGNGVMVGFAALTTILPDDSRAAGLSPPYSTD